MQQACPPRRSSGPPGHGPSGLDAPVEESFSTRPNARQLRSTLRPRGAPVLAIALVVFGAAVPSVRHGALRRVGGLLVVSDPIVPGDVVAISESGGPGEFQAAEIEAADLVQRRQFSRVMLLRADDMDRMSDELARRGVRLEDPVLATLRQLGVPESAIVTVDAGEGGTTESTRALATWVHAHPSRVLVVIGAAHSRRYRRALLRVWPPDTPKPHVTYPQRTFFRPNDWWTSRRSVREGVFELEKLAWDYVVHPW